MTIPCSNRLPAKMSKRRSRQAR